MIDSLSDWSPEEHLLDQPVGSNHPHLAPSVQTVQFKLAAKCELKKRKDDGKLLEICVLGKSGSPRNVGGGFVTVSSCSCSSAVDVRCPDKLKFSRL